MKTTPFHFISHFEVFGKPAVLLFLQGLLGKQLMIADLISTLKIAVTPLEMLIWFLTSETKFLTNFERCKADGRLKYRSH